MSKTKHFESNEIAYTHTPRVSFSRFSPSRGAHTPDAFSDPRNGQFPGQTSLVRAIGQMHGSACPLTGESCKWDEDRITRSGARQTERDTVSWPRGRGLVVPRRIEEVATRTRRNAQHRRMRCLFAGGTFSSDSQWPAACRTCRRACASLRSRAAVADWPSIDRSYTRFGSRAFREGEWSRVGIDHNVHGFWRSVRSFACWVIDFWEICEGGYWYSWMTDLLF